MKEFLHRNKVAVGVASGLIAGYIHFACPGIDPKYCAMLTNGFSYLSAYLVGAGAMDSDERQKYVQGIKKGE